MPDVEAKPAALKKLAEGEDSARHSYWLATIVTDAPLDFRPADNLLKPPSERGVYDRFLKLEFSRLIEKFDLRPAQPEQETPEQFERLCVRWSR
jgi:DNA polymerase-1